MGDVDRTKAEVEAHESKDNPHSKSASATDLSNHAGDSAAHHDRPQPGVNLTENDGTWDAKGGLWTLLGTHSDDTTGTLFDSGSISVTAYDEYLVVYSLATNASGNGGIKMRVNGDSSTSYDQNWVDGGEGTGLGAANLIASVSSNLYTGAVWIWNRPTQTDVTGGYAPKYSHQGGAFSGNGVALNGSFPDGSVSSIRLWHTSGTESTGNVEIYGRNY